MIMAELETLLGRMDFYEGPFIATEYVENPEYKTAKYEKTYTGWCDGSVQFRRRFKDPQGKIEVPRFIPKLT